MCKTSILSRGSLIELTRSQDRSIWSIEINRSEVRAKDYVIEDTGGELLSIDFFNLT